jgi:polyisoprenoid-binding protein YceI
MSRQGRTPGIIFEVMRSSTTASLLLVLLPPLFSTVASAEPRRFMVEPASSRFVVHVGKTGLFGFAGHEHEVVAPVHEGTITIDRDHPESSSVELQFEAAALRVTGQGEPAGDVPKVQEAMVGAQCLDAHRFQTIRFISNAVKVTAKASGSLDVLVRGALTIHGVSREVSVPVHLVLAKDSLSASGTTKLQQTAFGIHPISVGGVVKVKDELDLDWHVRARAAP